MVEIIDDGPDPSVTKEKVCEHCGARLRYVPNDIKSRNGQDYSGGPDGCTYIVCPKCGGHAVLSRW